MANCIRCGSEAHNYGTDGLSYCDSCSFYGMNVQCQKCGMYLPRLELQMYRGNWYCPYCIADLKEESSREEYPRKEEKAYEQKVKTEQCERCGTILSTAVYVFKGRQLCVSCLNQERGEESGPVTPPVMKFLIGKKEEPAYAQLIRPVTIFSEGLFGWLLMKLGLRKKEMHTEVLSVIEEEERLRKKERNEKKKSKEEEKEESEEKQEEEKKENEDWKKHKKD